jgi:hypothetical protein
MHILHWLCEIFCEIITSLKYQGTHMENCATIDKTDIFRQTVLYKGKNPFNQVKKWHESLTKKKT